MRKYLCIVLIALTLLGGCARSVTAEDVAGKTYTYEEPGFGGSFTIRIDADGTFQYYEGLLSSYIGMGEWTLMPETGTLCLEDFPDTHYGFTNYFKVDGGDLLFLAEESDNFLYLKVADGDRFTGAITPQEETP